MPVDVSLLFISEGKVPEAKSYHVVRKKFAKFVKNALTQIFYHVCPRICPTDGSTAVGRSSRVRLAAEK